MKRTLFTNLFYLLLCLGITSTAYTQALTNVDELKKISEAEAAAFNLKKAEALKFAKDRNLPEILETPDKRYAELQYIDEYGAPQYYITDNADAAKTISTNQVFSGGSAGLNLNGTGITIRQWDGGAVRITHNELTGRAVMGDGSVTLNYHSTHVAGTLIASGVNAAAKGMAPNAQLRAFDWNSDAAEMAAEAANGAMMSNHSYGYVRGWYWSGSSWTWYGNQIYSTQEDYLFGFYDSQAQTWDNIARNAPYYLICKSAGNDRNEGPTNGQYPPDGPYDCIGHAGIAKNILTVGAVYDITTGYTGPSSVVMSPFSGWGPADDGRIKPDIVASGITLYSTDKDNNSDYTTLSGTSMSSPSIAGSLALLQQHWNNLNPGTYMLASTLKALVIHTADEAGPSEGPDYMFGWGLMNTTNAALKISEDQTLNVIEELVLANGGIYTRTVQSDGTQPMKVTICWTDPAGTPVSAQLDPITPMLVNDLDLRLTSSTATHYPWKLDRNNPANPATNSAENNVDNVEMVYIANPVAGEYTIIVDHDGALTGGSQTFSIIISGTIAGPSGPDCSTPVNPVAGATGVPVNTTLSWTPVEDADGYLLYFGTNNPPTNLENGTDLGNITVYTPVNALSFSTNYYWKVVPYNIYGQATGCPVWSFVTESSIYITLPYSESFESGFGQWTQAIYDDFDWTRRSGATPTAKTGPGKATNGSYYIYTEASPPQAPGDMACLEATFSFAGIPNPEISLYYHMFGNQMGSLHVDVFSGGFWNTLWSISGQQHPNEKAAFKNIIVSLANYGNQDGVTLRIRGVIGSGERSDLAVDLVQVRQQGTKSPSGTVPFTDILLTVMESAHNTPVFSDDGEVVYGYNKQVIIRNLSGEVISGEVGIFNTMGQLLYSQSIDGTDTYRIEPGLKPGLYIIRLITNDNTISRKVLLF